MFAQKTNGEMDGETDDRHTDGQTQRQASVSSVYTLALEAHFGQVTFKNICSELPCVS